MPRSARDELRAADLCWAPAPAPALDVLAMTDDELIAALRGDATAYRALAQVAIHRLAELETYGRRQRETIARLREELRRDVAARVEPAA